MRFLNERRASALMLAVAVAGLACQKPSAREDQPSAVVRKRVRCEEARTSERQDTLELHGTVAPLPDRDAQIAAQVAGRIVRVLVREGDHVTRNQALARIDDAALLDQAKQVAAQMSKAHAEAVLAATSRARVQRVFDRGIVARQELDDASARQTTAEANEAEAKATSQIARRQLDRAIVRSPLAGVVLKVFRKTGELVDGTGAAPIVEVGDPSSLELLATATAAELVASKVGATAIIDIPSVPGMSLTGTIVAVSPAVDRSTGLGVVRVSLKLSGDVAPPVGVTGTARVVTGRARTAVVVPDRALRSAVGSNAEVVICGADGHARVVAVRRALVGASRDGLVEILSPAVDAGGPPVTAGTRVAVEPVLGLRDGDWLELVHD